MEHMAESKLLDTLSNDLKEDYKDVWDRSEDLEKSIDENEEYLLKLVKAADKLSALIKCVNEVGAGNHEFVTAKESTEKSVRKLYAELPEDLDFVNEFMSSYGSTLDELLG